MKDVSYKCIKIQNTDGPWTFTRVTSDIAFDLVHRGPWSYCPRSEWKAAGRKWGVVK